jgi:hypothetical protein
MSRPDGQAPAGAFGPSLKLRIVLIVASSLLALAVAEIAVRLVLPQPLVEGEHFYAPSRELGWTNAPGYRGRLSNLVDFDTAIRINSLGMRGDEPTEQRPRVLGVGDSFMFGYGVEEGETFLARAATIAGAVPLNGGVPGYDPCQAVDFAGQMMRVIDVDALVLAVFLGNDEWDTGAGRGRMEVRQGFFVEPGSTIDPSSLWRRIRHPLFAHSHLVRFLRYSPLSEMAGRVLFGKESIDKRALQGLLWAYQLRPPQIVLDGDRLIAPCLHKMRQLTAARGIPAVALLVPDELEVVAGRLDRAAAAAGEGEVAWDVDGPRRRFSALLNQAGIPVIDPTPELRAAAATGTKLYFTRDRHFTVTGSRIVGDKLGSMLRQIKRAPPAPTGPLTPRGFS